MRKLHLQIIQILFGTLIIIFSLTQLATAQVIGKLKAPEPSKAFAIKIAKSGNQWWTNIDIVFTNISATTQNIANANIEFNLPAPTNEVHGNFPIYPDIKINTMLNNNAANTQVALNNPSWNVAWDTQLPKPISVNPGQSFTISFGVPADIDANLLQKSIKIYTGMPPVADDGKIIMQMPAAPEKNIETMQPTITLHGPNGIQSIAFKSWNTTLVLEKQVYGEYTIHADTISGDFGHVWQQKGSDAKIVLSNSHKEDQAIFAYEKVPLQTDCNVSIPAKPELTAPEQVTAYLEDTTTHTAATELKLSWGMPFSTKLVVGHQYLFWVNGFATSEYKYIPIYNKQKIEKFAINKVEQGKPITLNLQFNRELIPVIKHNVGLTIIGLPNAAKVNITFTGKNAYSHLVTNQQSKFFDAMVAGQYNIAADIYEPKDASVYYEPTFDSPVIVDGDKIFKINYKKIIKSNAQYAVYWASWSPWNSSLDEDAHYLKKVTILNLAFGNIVQNGSDFELIGSDGILDAAAAKINWGAAYHKWTLFKFHHPQTKVLLAIGGASYSAIWNSVLTDEVKAKKIADLISRSMLIQYPVYKFDDRHAEVGQYGTVQFDGVDLDVEAGGRFQNQTALIALIKELRKLPAMQGKLITLTTLHVAADPVECQNEKLAECSYPYSQFSGEHVETLKAVGKLVDYVNIMAYDAGPNYPYQVAIKNYMQYVAKEKINLGLDLERQWPGFIMDETELLKRAYWSTHNEFGGLGGAMVWGYGVSATGYDFENQKRLIKEFGDKL